MSSLLSSRNESQVHANKHCERRIPAFKTSIVPERRQFEVVIIGAGASGLSAAKELEANGVSSIIILEACDRIGGRIKTMTPNSGGFLELGAQWIHGQQDNELYSLMVPRGLIGDYVSVDGEGYFYTDKGEKIDNKVVTEMLEVMREIKRNCQEELVNSDVVPELSVGDFFRARFEEYLSHKEMQSETERELREAFYHWYMRWERIDNACDSLHQLSAKRWEYFACRGFYNMNPKYGMNSLILSLRNDVSAEVKLGTEATKIEHKKELVQSGKGTIMQANGIPPVTVKCSNGDVFECNHVIVTCSLGYLKRHNESMFSPPLPLPSFGAVTNIGFGVIDKIFLEFEKPFWGPDFTGVHLVWTGNEIPDFDRKEQSTRLVDGRTLKPEDYWYRAISGFDPIYGHSSILCGWIGGPEAQFMEGLDEGEVAQTCVRLLRKFTDNPSIPDPVNIYRSQWCKDEFFLGSYSHRLESCDHLELDLIRDLNEPIWGETPLDKRIPLIVFAGEANNLSFYSTVHGAVSSGFEQAQHYISFRKRYGQHCRIDHKSRL